ncbi:heat shock protein 70 family [Chlamydoabsidia padenii]|nr:heat shock protein 70 family [Chlamydoabsidia padenii]
MSGQMGIDLGTTYSCVAVWEENRVEVIANDMGSRTTASYVGFTDSCRVVGDVVKISSLCNMENSVHNVKRLIGRDFKDAQVQADLANWDFKVTENKVNGQPSINVTFERKPYSFSPEEVSAMILGYLKETAARYLNLQDETALMKCVITVPAYFNHAQRQATKDAGTIAGLEVLQIINEPTSAALAYGLQHQNNEEKHNNHHVLVYDFGGGTFDVSILRIDQGIFTVMATGGNSHLGGEDIDVNMMNYFIKTIQRTHGIDLTKKDRERRRLKFACERAKRILSGKLEDKLDLPFFLDGEDYYAVITRRTFEEINMELFDSTMETVKNTLADAKLDKADIDEIVMVGGSARIPKLRQMLSDFFGKKLNMSVNPDEVVACGAAIQAAVLCEDLEKDGFGRQVILRDVTPLSLGTRILGDIMSTIVQRNTSIPVTSSHAYRTAEDDQTRLRFNIYQGERKKATENSLLGIINMDGLPPAPRGESKVDVTFEVGVDGILKVTVKSVTTGESKQVKINSGRLTKFEIEEMKATAAKFKLVDDAHMEKNNARQSLKNYAYGVRFYPMDSQVGNKERTVNGFVKEVLYWITDNPQATKEEYDIKKKELEKNLEPWI